MTDTPVARNGRGRRRVYEALFGGGLALLLITAANATLPRIIQTAPAPRPRVRVRAVAPPPQPQPPPPFLAFQDPAPGHPVISPFGLRQLPWEEAGRLHAGVDIAAPAGEPVRAAADGVIVRLASDPGFGRFVEIRHAAGLTSRYGHLAGYLPGVAPGVAVKAGAVIGAMGSSGASTGSHVHFEIRDPAGRPLNPELFLGRSFAQQADLPIRQALRWPRGVRTAYVSNIPKSKRDEMDTRLQLAAAADAASAGAADLAPSAGDAAVDAAFRTPRPRNGRPRPHARFRPAS
jgi:murein DD-endopeptidase MepM/ murein hydrolase activator NlpD